MSSKIQIIARASDERASLKLERAGANRVVSPYSTGAQKIARFMLNPNIEDFLEIADHKGQDLELADVQIYLIRLADKLNVELLQAVRDKMVRNTEKYSATEFKGSARKYSTA